MICPECNEYELVDGECPNCDRYVEETDSYRPARLDDVMLEPQEVRRVYDVLQTLTNDQGEYIPIICIEGESGYHKTDWTWGKDFKTAKKIAREKNLALGYDAKTAYQIIATTYRQGV